MFMFCIMCQLSKLYMKASTYVIPGAIILPIINRNVCLTTVLLREIKALLYVLGVSSKRSRFVSYTWVTVTA